MLEKLDKYSQSKKYSMDLVGIEIILREWQKLTA